MSTELEEQQSSYDNQVKYYTDLIKKNPEYELVDVYADEGITGTSTKKREEFNRMIDDCRAGLIDIILTKSISRFARNTLDCLNYVRELKEKGICIIFEKENINTLDAKGEVLLTILSSLAQDESRSISENSAWGIRRRFEQGKHKTSTKRFLGYDYNEQGKLVVNRPQARIVKRIYEEFLKGRTPDDIARLFREEQVPNWDGKYNWGVTAINSMLQNEKYMGDVILQKSYTADFLTKKRVINNGELQKYHIKEDHEPIIDTDTWNAVQQEIERRAKFCEAHFTNAYAQIPHKNPFSCKVICGECGHIYSRVVYMDRKQLIKYRKMRCGSCNKTNGHKVCSNRYIEEDAVYKLFMMAWNEIAGHCEEYEEKWKKNLEEGNELLRYKTKQIMEAAKKGPIKEFDDRLMIMVMDIITVYEIGRLTIRFYDGTEFVYDTE